MKNNYVRLSGVIDEPFTKFKVKDDIYYKGFIRIPRKSNLVDIIPVTIPARLAPNGINQCYLTIEGEYRSSNKIVDGKNRLLLSVFAKSILENRTEIYENIVKLIGFIGKEPIYRETPRKRRICDIMLAVNRNNKKSDYIPLIVWDSLADNINDYFVGSELAIEGRIQSREYQKNGETRVAYEVSVNWIQPNISEFEPLEEIEL